MAVDNPRSLKEITEYRDLLNARDDAMALVNAVLALENPVIETNFNVTVQASLKPATTGPTITSQAFNKYTAIWLKKNIRTVAPDIIALIDAEIATNKLEAEEEAGLLGMNASSILAPAPSITSPDTATVAAGAAFEYQTVADNTSGTGISSLVYALGSGTPSWLSINADTGKVTGTVPSSMTTGDTFSFTVTVTTNNGTDSKGVTVTIS